MSRLPENDNIRNDIYENLPCQAMYNESVHKLKTTTNNESSSTQIQLNNSNQQQQQTQLNLSLNANNKKSNHLPKELLYATPLRKSDRYKSNERSSITNKNNSSSHHHRYNNKIINNDDKKLTDKLTNNFDYKLINKDNNILLKNCGSGKISPSISPQLLNHIKNNTNSEIINHNQHHHHHHLQQQQQQQHLEDRRILNFLKDTTQCQKKMEMISGGKDCPNASFSCLAREEHFANLVQQNFVIDQQQTIPNLIKPDNQESNLILNNISKLDGANNVTIDSNTTNLLDNNSSSILKSNVIHTTEESVENLQLYMHNKKSPDKEVNGFVVSSTPSTTSILPLPRSHTNVYINREWVLKKIALCLEQRTSGKKCNSINGKGIEVAIKETVTSASAFLPRPQNIGNSTTYHGCLVLGSNGSGKTSICQAIMNGNSGTKGILNRKLLSCYLVNSQNPDCHSLSIFIRSMILQILSHSSLIAKTDQAKILEESLIQKLAETNLTSSSSPADDDILNINKHKINLNHNLCDNAEELLIAELKRNADIDLLTETSIALQQKKIITRQKSAPSPEKKFNYNENENENENHIDNSNNNELINICDSSTKNSYSTHPPSGGNKSNKSIEKRKQQLDDDKDDDDDDIKKSNDNSSKINDININKSSPGKKSKIPVSITTSRTTNSATATTTTSNSVSKSSNTTIQQGGGEDIADVLGDDMKDEIEAEINDDHIIECSNNTNNNNNNNNNNSSEIKNEEFLKDIETEQNLDKINDTNELLQPPPKREIKNETEDKNLQQQSATSVTTTTTTTAAATANIPIPLPKPKSCRTIIADSYYEMLLSNPEIFECLNVDNIEKNPDECFKKGILFPLLELTPPRTALLLLIDSIDENYINEGSLISTLKGRTMSQKSRNIAELLSNHIHLFPKWLFLVCTTKKQTKHITKMFTGFKKITLDDLRKSHVVKDVQEYIINRLNTDFKGTINLTKEIIESLHQLYIKSNGCILYLEKVLNGIKENFFSFREIKLIPCTLNGLYLYICQKSFNKKQYLKIRPILNVLLASTGFVDRLFLFNCLRTYNYTIDIDEFEKRLDLMKNILIYEGQNQQQYQQFQRQQRYCNNNGGLRLKIFHNSFADWLVDVKFATKKFICDVNEGHIMISMYYTLISESLCANSVRRFVYHLIKSGEYLTNKNINLDLILMLLESRINLNDCFYTNHLNCCTICENEYRNDQNFLPKTREMIRKFLMNELNDEFSTLLCDFFKPSLPTDAKTLKLLIETGINNADSQASCDSSLMSPELSEKSVNIDFELADLLLSSEKTCQEETQRPKSSSDKSDQRQAESQDDNTSTLHQLSDSHRIEMHKGKALIHILASDGNHLLLERALNACKGPIDLEIEDYNGQTALNIAARNGHLDVVKLLLNFTQPLNDGTGRLKRVDVNHADRDGWTPLRSASWGGHTEVVKLLIAYPGCSIDLADKEGRTALRAAAWSGHEDILKILIEAGADVNSVDRQGRTSLIAASYMGHYDIVEILLDNGANVNHLDLDGRSALCVAALCGSSGYSKVISTLLEHGANTDQLDNDGMSPLLVSSFEGNGEVCELLLENGADPDLADFMGRTPLWAACTAGHANVVKLLLFWGCGIDCMDSEGRTVLSIAAAQGNVETVRQLLDRGLDETHRDNAGWTPLHYAAFEGFHDVCIQILESGAKIDECDNEGKTALHLAAQEGRQNCIQSLLEIHSTFVDQKAHDGKTAFRLACLEGHIDCIQTLLKFGCDVNAKDADSRTTLYILALENKLEVVKYLVDVTDVDINIPDSEGRTALHVASWQGHSEMVKLLITLGNANVNAMDLELRSPLHSCAWQGNHDVMGILLYFGAIPDHACKQGATALGISAQEGHDKCVAILLKYGANPYKSDHCGRTPIKLAAKSNRNNILKIFESYTKTDESNIEQQKVHPNMLRSPDQPPIQGFLPHQTNQLIPNNNNVPPSTTTNILNASSSTHSSNFYENTMQSDNSSLQKRKSVISSQSTGSSNDQVPLSFTQQLQRHTKLSSRNNPFVQNTPVINMKYSKGQQRHSQILPDLNEHQLNIVPNLPSNDADMFDMECMSPLYATPPHSPSSDLSSPGQMPTNHTFEEIGKSINNANNGSGSQQKSITSTDNHFARDTHMRIILGNCKETNHSSSKSKRSGIATNPAMRMIRNRFDSAANLIRRTNNMLSSNSQGSSSIGVKSGTFQWRKESQM